MASTTDSPQRQMRRHLESCREGYLLDLEVAEMCHLWGDVRSAALKIEWVDAELGRLGAGAASQTYSG